MLAELADSDAITVDKKKIFIKNKELLNKLATEKYGE